MNRTDRLAAILIQLQSRPLIKGRDLAERFSISLRTVYRDIHALEEAGVPVIGEGGTGYRLMEGYKLPPVMFTADEASALLTAAKLIKSKTDVNTSAHYNSALDKIKAVLRAKEKDHIAEIDAHIAVVSHPAIVYDPPQNLHLQPVLKAIAAKNVMEIRYTSIDKNETLLRKVEPVGVYYLGSHWYLVAFCRLRNDYRNFRTDKISQATVTTETISRQHPSLQRFISEMTAERELRKVVIDVPPDIVKYFGDQKYYNGFVKEENFAGKVRMTFLTGSLTGFARWFMIFGDQVSIIEPLELGEMVSLLATDILKKVAQTELLLT